MHMESPRGWKGSACRGDLVAVLLYAERVLEKMEPNSSQSGTHLQLPKTSLQIVLPFLDIAVF